MEGWCISHAFNAPYAAEPYRSIFLIESKILFESCSYTIKLFTGFFQCGFTGFNNLLMIIALFIRLSVVAIFLVGDVEFPSVLGKLPLAVQEFHPQIGISHLSFFF